MKHNAFSLPGFLALLMAATPTAAQKVDEEVILAAICETGQIREGECLKAHNYPSGPSCNVRLDGEIIEGRFFGPERTFLLAGYSSNCEPHASNFGGSLIFEKVSAKLIFKAFEVGLAVSNCITLAKTNGGDQLICNLLGMAQGYESQLIGEVVFAGGEPDQLTTSFVELLAAENSWAARAPFSSMRQVRGLFRLCRPFGRPVTGHHRVRYLLCRQTAHRKTLRPLRSKIG